MQETLPFGAAPATAPLSKAPALNYRTPSGDHFCQPRLYPEGIVISAYTYVRMELADVNGERPIIARSSFNVFHCPGKIPVWKQDDPVFGTLWLIPANLRNLEEFIKLPEIPVEQMIEAAKLYEQWSLRIPSACLRAIVLRAGTEVRPGGTTRHRLPMLRRTERVEERELRPLSEQEKLAALLYRKPLPTEAERTSVTFRDVVYSEPFEEATRYQMHSNRMLYSQQLIGAWAIGQAKRIGVFYDMRVGKTETAEVAAKEAILVTRECDYLLVICPKINVFSPWVPDLQRLGFEVRVLDGTESEDAATLEEFRREDYAGPTPARPRPVAIVTNYERVGSRFHLLADNLDLRRLYVCMDETSAIKNPAANRSKACHYLCRFPAYVVLLNGTPMEQGPHDLYSQLRCLDPWGVVVGKDFREFVDMYLEEVAPGKYRVRNDNDTKRRFEMMLATMSIRYIRGEADQFAGKDKSFRYIKLRPTKQMAEQAANVLDGFLRTVTEHGDKVTQALKDCVLVTYGFLREISCGYDKYREVEGAAYQRVRHEIDPKLLWVRCLLEANPTTPLVIFTNFNEQEQRLKEMLTEMNVPWASTKPAMHRIEKRRFKTFIPTGCWQHLLNKFGAERVFGEYWQNGTGMVEVPLHVRYDAELAAYARDQDWRWGTVTEVYYGYKDREFTDAEKAEEINAFNRGDRHVFILKVKQGRGITLARAEARAAKIGTWPDIVYLSPPWSLGDWDQSGDRCVFVDEATGKNVCTNIYVPYIPGMEEKILKALRSKKDVQVTLLKDAERQGYASFMEGMVEDMEKASKEGGSGYFDADEMHARILCGVPPYSKLTESIILNKMLEKFGKSTYGWRSKTDVLRWLQQERSPVAFNEDGACLNPEMQIRDAYFRLMDIVQAQGEDK